MATINSINSTFPPPPPPCLVATTAAFASVTYTNATATAIGKLTNAGTQAALSIDGVSVAVGDRVLVKNQGSGFQNGIYVVNDIGSGSTNWVIYRAADYSVPSSIYAGQLIFVTSGTVNANSIWQQTATGPFTMGTTALTFAAYAGQSTITTLGTITTGVWTGTTIVVANGGTGNTTFTAYSVICAGTTATGVFQNVSGLGTTGQLLTSNGAGALPTWQTGSGSGPSAASQANQEAATSTTVYTNPGVQQYHPSAPKAWGVFDATGALGLSYGTTSVTDTSTSVKVVNLSITLSGSTYAVVVQELGSTNAADNANHFCYNRTTTAFNIYNNAEISPYAGDNYILMGDLP